MDMIYTDWGKIRYEEAWQRQRRLFEERLEQKKKHDGPNPLPDCLVACEHYPVLTLGKSGRPDNLLVSDRQLSMRGVEFFRTDRGGDITYHGPGQIVMYPIFDLSHYGIGLREYIFRVEEAVIRFLQHYGIQGERLEGATGVWLSPHSPQARKICAIGVKSSRYVTMHGLALNINTDLSYFSLINPCGFTDKGVTSLQLELGQRQDFEQCKLLLRDQFFELFIPN
ncbi:MAG: lipoyl(octanoyl) transferase LipB [Bacteroidales bacterium]|nr:lipoyl(octanoyl) transferase LipB [Bacteroidales bacterium]